MPALTATLIAHNEELDLPRALASLSGVADEIILVDSGSTDRTCDIARDSGARVYSRKLDSLAEQKNYAASFASNDWILSIDCDEELSPELRASILAWKQTTPDHVGYEFPADDELSGRLDPAFGLVSRLQIEALPARPRQIRQCPARGREAGRRAAGRSERPPAALHRADVRGAQGQDGLFLHHGARKTCSRADAEAGEPR